MAWVWGERTNIPYRWRHFLSSSIWKTGQNTFGYPPAFVSNRSDTDRLFSASYSHFYSASVSNRNALIWALWEGEPSLGLGGCRAADLGSHIPLKWSSKVVIASRLATPGGVAKCERLWTSSQRSLQRRKVLQVLKPAS